METFVVQIWTPAPEVEAEVTLRELHGVVEHIGSKQQVAFRSDEELLDALRRAFEREPAPPPP